MPNQPTALTTLADLILRLQPIVLGVTAFAFWYASPVRDAWVWLIGLQLPILAARWWRYRRLATSTPLDEVLLALLGLCLVNLFVAPYETRGLILIYRPLFGVALVYYCVEFARQQLTITVLLRVTVISGGVLGIVALTATQWAEGKRLVFDAVLALIPVVDTYPGVGGLFNPNEIAGAMTWVAPLCAGLALLYWRNGQRVWGGVSAASAGLLLLALILGQSLSALVGVAAGLVLALIPARWWRVLGIMGVAGILAVQVIIVIVPRFATDTASTLSRRAEIISLEHRAVMWQSARQAVIDHPLTGIGMAMYRSPSVWEDYPTPGFERGDAVHAHNELLHIGTDLGLPGAAVLLGMYAAVAYMLHTVWQRHDPTTQRVAIALSGGFVAHSIYGLGDAIPLWDRFAFIGWWMLGITVALLIAQRYAPSTERDQYSTTDSQI
ncbi:MAG: O-antigen ligase family protein [Armatimonadetes bacterium]|nr:O-antigen ligase family protein [Anaerolineae bacterium]